MPFIYLLIVVTAAQPASWTIPTAWGSMEACEAAKKERGLDKLGGMCVEIKTENWR
jgi:hypothetical protein